MSPEGLHTYILLYIYNVFGNKIKIIGPGRFNHILFTQILQLFLCLY